MLTSISIENFKSYREADLPLAPLTLLVGANASGKSNAIEAMRFLSLLAQGRRLDDIFRSVDRGEVPIRGTMSTLTFDGRDSVTLGCSLSDAGPWTDMRMRIRTEEHGMRIIEESIKGSHSAVPLYTIKRAAEGLMHEVQVAYNNFARGGIKPTIPCTDQQAILTQLETPSRFKPGEARSVIPEVVQKYQQALKDILFLDPSPRLMRTYSRRAERTLLGDGSNLSSVLYSLCEEQGRRSDVLDFIRHLPEQDIHDVTFVEVEERAEVMLRLVETFGGTKRHRDAPVLSDGTLRVLALAAALYSAPEGALVIIEEIDNGVHPSRAGALLRSIRQVATERGLRVLLTSHNPALLDELPTEAVPDVVCCYRDPEGGDSRLVRLEDLARYPDLVARGPVGQLMTRGILDRFLKDSQSPEERKASADAWLRSLSESGV
jgi:predicted ATPase